MRRKDYKVGDRVFYEDYRGGISSALILRIEQREMDTDIYGRPMRDGRKFRYELFRTGHCTFIEDYNCLSENDKRVVEYKKGRRFVGSDFRQKLVDFMTANGALAGDEDVAEILYDLASEYEQYNQK